MVAHYGSAAAEVAVCMKAAGLVERDDLAQPELSGDEPFLEHALAAAVPHQVGCSRAATRAIEDGGRGAGLARVGGEALAYLRAARRMEAALS